MAGSVGLAAAGGASGAIVMRRMISPRTPAQPPADNEGMLILCGAPLGNPGDASARLRQTLASAEIIAAEDTRRLVRLARELDITMPGKLISYFEGNEDKRTPDLVEQLTSGVDVARSEEHT